MPKLYETPAETMLRVERQNIASTGQATPTPVTGSISANTNLPSGFGSDATGRIFKMPVSPAPASTLPVQNTAPIQQSTQGASPSSAAETPAGRVYSNLVTPEDSALAAAYAAREKQILDAQSPTDEQSIRDKTMARFQAEIDSLNQFYAQKKAEALAREAPLAAGRLGTNRAIQARRGLLGGTFGEAETSRTNEYNRSVEQNIADTINVERDRALSAILGKAQSQAQEEIIAKQKARDESYQAHIDFLKGKAERKEARVNSLVSNLVGSGSNLSDVDFASDDMKKTASDLGISVEALKARYDDAKRGYDLESGKSGLKPIEVSAGSTVIDPTTGKVIYSAPEKTSQIKPIVSTYKGVTKVSTDNGRTWVYSDGRIAAPPTITEVAAGSIKYTGDQATGQSAPVDFRQSKQTFAQFLDQEQEKAGMTFNQRKRDELKAQFDKSQVEPTPISKDIDLSGYSFLTQQVIRGDLPASEILTGGTATERRRYENELVRAQKEGLLKKAPTGYQLKEISRIDSEVSKSPAYTKTASMRAYADNVTASLSQETGVGDIAAINQFQKVIDEGAVTRDQDVKLIQGAQSLVNRIKTKVANLERGETLSAELRQQMVDAVQSLYDAQVKAIQKDPFIKSKINELKNKNISPEETVLGQLSSFKEQPTQSTAADILAKYNIQP